MLIERFKRDCFIQDFRKMYAQKNEGFQLLEEKHFNSFKMNCQGFCRVYGVDMIT